MLENVCKCLLLKLQCVFKKNNKNKEVINECFVRLTPVNNLIINRLFLKKYMDTGARSHLCILFMVLMSSLSTTQSDYTTNRSFKL